MKTVKLVFAAVAAGLAMLAEAGELLSTDFTSVTSLPEGWTATHGTRADVSYDSTKGAYVTNWNKNTLYTSLTTHPKMKTSIHLETYANNAADINAVIALGSDSYSIMIGNSYSNHPKIQIGSFNESVNGTYLSFKSADGKAPSNPTELATSTEITISKSLTYDLELFGTSLTGTVTDGTNTKEISYTLPAATSFTHIGFSLDGANGTVGIKKVTVSETAPHTFKVGLEGDEAGKFWLDGKEFLIRCGEMHYGRIPKGYWRDRIRKTKAMGFNAVCAYMFWNNHEPMPGHFRFDGEQDVREFCEIAQEEGMWVVLRPGPYTCAEWEFGGYPWWLLSSKMSEDGTINIRTKDADYRQYTDRYMQKVGEQLADMQITRGGNIIMIQVENEYGTYGNDAEYMKMEYDAIVNAGFEIQKFTCNPTFNNGVTNARIPELFYVVNGSGGFFEGENRMQKLIDARLPGWENAPQMIGEYYTAWYDSWGGTHQTKSAQAIVNDFATFIERGVSFSVYMVYGGTSFGYWGGFNTPFVPMTTSYDYDSPINETGKLTDKFYAIKELFDQNLNEGETAVANEDVSAWVGVQTGTIAATPTYASLWDAPSYTTVISEATDAPLTFENADLGYGYAIYETTLAAGQGGKLMADCRDLGVVRVDGEFVGYLDRRTTWGWVEIPTADKPRKLEILVEALGRNHYAAFNDASKGLRGKPTLDKVPLSGWTMKTFNFLKWDEEKGAYASEMDNLEFVADAKPSARSGSFYKYNVTLDPSKDALLDMRAWRRGMVCVNGTWVGRYWTIGPQQTLYIPGCWLKAGENANEIIILDTVGVEPQNELTFAETHIISENRSDLDYYVAPELPEQPKSLEALWGEAVKTGNLANNRSLQTVNFDEEVTGRYFAFKATSAHSGQYAACAEFNLLDAAGNALDRSNWTIVSCSSQEQRGEDAQIEKMLDGNNSTIWHSEWKVVQSTLPQYFVIDLGEEKTVGGFTLLGRQSGDAGFVNAYSVYMMNENPVIDPETGVTISSGTLEAPFTISSAADINNVKVTLKSGAVMKVMSSTNCKLTITGEGKDSILILDGAGDYGLNAGSKLENLTILIDTENAARKIWLETRDPAPYDETTHLVIKNGSAVISGGGAGVTFGTLTIDGGTLDIRNSTPITVTGTLYLREGATQPSGVTLAEGAQIEYIVEKLSLVLDPTCFKEDGSEKALDLETLASAKFVGIADSSTLELTKIDSVTIRDSVNLGIRPALKGLKLIVENNSTVRFPISGSGMNYCLEGVDVEVKSGSTIKITRAWGTGWTKGSNNTFNLKDSRIYGEGTAVVPTAVTITLDNSSIELPFAVEDQAKVTLPEGLAFDAQGYVGPKAPPAPEAWTDVTDETDIADIPGVSEEDAEALKTADIKPTALATWAAGKGNVEIGSAINLDCFLMNVSNAETAPELLIAEEDFKAIMSATDLEAAADALKAKYPNAKVTVEDVTEEVAGEGATNTHLFRLKLNL